MQFQQPKISKFTWQVEEYVSLSFLLPRILWANQNQAEVVCTWIEYGAHSQQRALLFLPIHLNHQQTAIFFVPGGGWRMGNPDLFRFIGYFFARLGFPTILAGYRMAPAFKFPLQLEDICLGFEAGLKTIKNQGLEIEKVILGGQSAGAQLVSLLTYDRSESTRRYLSQGDIAGLLLISGPLNFSFCGEGEIFKLIVDYVDNLTAWEQADPIRHIHGDEDIPVLCLHGQKDPLVDIQSAFTFAAQVKPGLSMMQVIMGAHHSDLVNLFWKKDHPATQIITAWLHRCIAQKSTVRTK